MLEREREAEKTTLPFDNPEQLCYGKHNNKMSKQKSKETLPHKKRTSPATIISWFFGILCFFTGFTLLPTKPLSGVLYVFAGGVVFPPLWKIANDRNWKYTPSTLVKITLFILFLFLGGALSEASNTHATTANQIALTTRTTAMKPDTKISARTKNPTATATPKPTLILMDRVTLDSLAPVLISFTLTQSNDRYIGYSQDGRNNITLIGDKNDIKTIMLSLNHIQSNDALYDSSLLQTTLQKTLPTWQGSSSWLENALARFSTSTDTGASIETDVENAHILLGYSPINNSENLTITLK